MEDWDGFVARVFEGDMPWFVPAGAQVEVGEARGWHRPAVAGLPMLSALLSGAAVVPVRVAGRPYELVTWGPEGARRGWLCEPPPGGQTPEVGATHRALWEVCGGIVEQFGPELGTWWLNLSDVLTVGAAEVDVAGELAAYRWMWEDDGLELPIDPGDYYAAGVEANGNLTLVHRRREDVVLFAPDHDFDDVTPLPGCPPYSLLTIDGVPNLTAWIESCAAAWRAA